MNQLKPIRRQTNLIVKKRYDQLIPDQYQLERHVKALELGKNDSYNHTNSILETFECHNKHPFGSKEKVLYILLVASEFKHNCLETKSFHSKYFPKSILKSLVANNINKALIGSGITFLVSDFPLNTLEITAPFAFENKGSESSQGQFTKGAFGEKIASKMDYKKICHSSFLYDGLESMTKEKDIDSIDLLDQCLGALIIKTRCGNKKAHVIFIEPSELKQSFQTYGKQGLNAQSKPNMLAFTHISQKLLSQPFQISLTSALPSVKLLTLFKLKILMNAQKT